MSFNPHNLKEGMLVTAYRKGYHRVVSITRRFATARDVEWNPKHYKAVGQEYSSLVTYLPVLSDTYKPIKGKKTFDCDIQYCQPITKEYIEKKREIFNAGLNILQQELDK